MGRDRPPRGRGRCLRRLPARPGAAAARLQDDRGRARAGRRALTLSVGGGLIGVAIGLFTARRLAEQFAWPMLVGPEIILIAVGFSALVGFGLYPARKASQLDPIEALRYE